MKDKTTESKVDLLFSIMINGRHARLYYSVNSRVSFRSLFAVFFDFVGPLEKSLREFFLVGVHFVLPFDEAESVRILVS